MHMQPCKKKKMQWKKQEICWHRDALFQTNDCEFFKCSVCFVLMLPPTGGQTEHQVSYSVSKRCTKSFFVHANTAIVFEFILIVFTLQDFGSENQI